MAAETFTIGKVVKMLEGEHPGLSVSKVRFLESSGLLKPRRTKSGYRVYTTKDVERLDTVLRLQETYFYPLSVIKERLDAADRGDVIPELGDASHIQVDDPSAPPIGPMYLDDAPLAIDVPVRFIRLLSDNGLVKLTSDERGRVMFSGDDVAVIVAAYELGKYGIDPRFLKPYLQRVNREVPLFRQALSTKLGRNNDLTDPKNREVFDDTLDHLVRLTNTVEEGIVRRSVKEEFNYPA